MAIFSGNPSSDPYKAELTLLDVNGKPIGAPVQTSIQLKKGNIEAFVSSIRLRSMSTSFTSFALFSVVDTKKEKKESVEYIEAELNQKDPNAPPIVFRMRKRPELLFQEWDATINDYISNIIDAPVLPGGNPLGDVYSTTVTMFDVKGKPVGDPQTLNVAVDPDPVLQPKIVETKLYSTDGGKNWSLHVWTEDRGGWVDKIVVEFVKPYATVAPLDNPVFLKFSGEKPGAMEMYSGSIRFDGNPAGETFGVIIYQYGTGTRTTTSQANNKAELL